MSREIVDEAMRRIHFVVRQVSYASIGLLFVGILCVDWYLVVSYALIGVLCIRYLMRRLVSYASSADRDGAAALERV